MLQTVVLSYFASRCVSDCSAIGGLCLRVVSDCSSVSSCCVSGCSAVVNMCMSFVFQTVALSLFCSSPLCFTIECFRSSMPTCVSDYDICFRFCVTYSATRLSVPTRWSSKERLLALECSCRQLLYPLQIIFFPPCPPHAHRALSLIHI